MKHGMLSNSLFLVLTQLVERTSAEAKEAHFVGDFNIDLLLRNDSNSRRLIHLTANFGLRQMIYQHVLPNNQKPFAITIIVHILNILFVFLVRSFGLSDHNPIVLVRKSAEKVSNTSAFLFAPWRKVDTNALIADLNRIPWSILDTYSNDPDEMLNTWN